MISCLFSGFTLFRKLPARLYPLRNLCFLQSHLRVLIGGGGGGTRDVNANAAGGFYGSTIREVANAEDTFVCATGQELNYCICVSSITSRASNHRLHDMWETVGKCLCCRWRGVISSCLFPQSYMIPLKQVLNPQEMKAIFVNLEVRELSFCSTSCM